MNQKLLLFDVDGTLISYDGIVPQSCVSAIREAKLNGHYVFVVTGRSKPHIEPPILNIGFSGIIGGNGAYIEVDGEVIKDEYISDEDVAMITDYLDEHHLEYYMEATDGLYGSHHFKTRGVKALQQYGMSDPKIEEIYPEMTFPENMHQSHINKINYILESYQDHLDFKERFPQFKNMTWGGHGESAIFGDCALADIDKSKAIHQLSDYLNVSYEDMIAFGDAEVDIPMFDCAKESVCMGEGRIEAKEHATYITSNVKDDGIRNALIHYNLISSERLTIMGTEQCRFCRGAKEKLDELNISYNFIEILDSLKNLKALIKVRDLEDVYSKTRNGDGSSLGIPLFILDGIYMTDLDEVINKLD